MEALSNRSERPPNVAASDLKGIMIHETRTSFEKTRNSGAPYQSPVRVNNMMSNYEESTATPINRV
jgi:hypothetical protein